MFLKADIADRAVIDAVLAARPDSIMHLVESHVDRSIDGPGTFIASTRRHLYAAGSRPYLERAEDGRRSFRFLGG
jgi:dTDP-glucose 4,6-dehydratase